MNSDDPSFGLTFGGDCSQPASPIWHRIWYLREASNVRRCHNTPHHGEYTVGKHSFDVLALLLTLNPEASPNLIRATAFHDMGERVVGDLPQSVKWWSPDIATSHAAAEEAVLELLQFNWSLTEQEALWLRWCDRLELMLWCLEQLAWGNQHIVNIARVLEKWFADQQHTLPLSIRELLGSLELYGWQRQPETLEGMSKMRPETNT